ncbi:MAG: glycosyltransferase [Candidatus Limivicinus sp.]|jgi:glycosyltransferase involved in cell wall biosynthesis
MSENNCKVSILCTAFNHEEYIAEALESFVSQKTDFSFEVIVNDDCSSDNTADIIREYAEKYPDIIRPLYQKENLFSRGLDYLYETAFYSRMRGEYIAFCEGDDKWLDENKLQLQVNFLDSHRDYSACVHNTVLHYCGSDRADELLAGDAEEDRDVDFETVLSGMSEAFHTSSVMARREFILNPPDYYCAAADHGFLDYPIALRLSLAGKIRFIARPMSMYRISSNSAAWSARLDRHYGKLKEFIVGELAMMEKLLPHLDSVQKEAAEKEILRRRYELLYIEGRVDEMVKPPYREIYKTMPLSYRVKTTIKRLCPALHRAYRKKQGYGDY